MRNLLLFFLFIFTIVGCDKSDYPNLLYGQKISADKKIVNVLKNGVLYLEFLRNPSGQVIEIRQYHDENQAPRKQTFVYNSDGHIIERNYQESFTDYYYYRNGKLVEMRSKDANNPEWQRRLLYSYDNKNRIDKAYQYSGKKKNGTIVFEYDRNNNTVARKHYYDDIMEPFEEYRFSYDDTPNPLHNLFDYPLDIMQQNNETSSYHYSLFMSCFPVTFQYEYIYNEDGFPVSVKKYAKKYPKYPEEVYTYVYK